MTDDRRDDRPDLTHLGTAPTVDELGDWADDLNGTPEAEPTPAPRARGGDRATGRKAGRPSKRTPETRDRLVRAASLGFSSLEAIARAAGVSKDTLDRMRAADPDLDAELHQSREAALDRIEASVLMAAAEDPRIGLAVLKVRRPAAYADRSRLEIGDGIRVGILAQLPSLTDDELGGAMRALEAVIGETTEQPAKSAAPTNTEEKE
jgi:transposase-like protein